VELLIVLGRVLSSSYANVIQKKLTQTGLHSFSIVMMSYCVLSVICVPLLWIVDISTLPNEFWLNSLFAAGLDMCGTLFLVMSLSKTDLSVFGPLNAYKVVISMILAMIFIGEIPSLQGFIGVLIILLGSFFLFPASDAEFDGKRLIRLLADRGVQYRFLSILLFSIGTIPLKTAVLTGGAMATTVFWCLMGFPLALLANRLVMKHASQLASTQTQHPIAQFIYLGLSMFIMQYMTMLVLEQLYIAYSLALFQLSMVLQVFLGHRLFNEPHLMRRLLSCGIMVAGTMLILNA
jgi:drug/metabolite transporter (DMT)-like permease